MIARVPLVIALAACAPSSERAEDADTGVAARLSSPIPWRYATGATPFTADAADLDGDGRLDLVLGREGSPAGSILVFIGQSGSAPFPSAPTRQFTVNETSSDGLEEEIALGDFDCDGNVDVAVGVHGASSGEVTEGLVFGYRGNGDGTFADRSGAPAPSWVLQPNVANEHFGTHLTAYDANHDGCTDLLVGGYTTLRGALGSATGPVLSMAIPLTSSSADVARVGDLNGDGNDDFAWWERSYGGGAGQVVVYLGTGTGFRSTPSRSYVGGVGDGLGGFMNTAGVTAGDVDGDGFDDLVIGAPQGNGRIDVYRGSASGPGASPTWSIAGASDNVDGFYGFSLVGGFDQNGDGYGDLLVGEPARDPGSSGNHGRWWLLPGSPTGPAVANPQAFVSTRDGKLGAYGHYAWTFGDLDRDGYDDVVLEDHGINAKLGQRDSEAQVLVGGPDVDTDGDGSDDPFDCAATDPAIRPGAVEIYGNLVDEDCSGADDCLYDADRDGYGSSTVVPSLFAGCSSVDSESATGGDCEDKSADVHPGAIDAPGSGRDEDCDGRESCPVDADADGYGSSTAPTVASPDLSCAHPGMAANLTDCNDGNSSAYPGAAELPGDGIDSDCNGAETCYDDNDADGWGSSSTHASKSAICAGSNESRFTGDCNDKNTALNPGETDTPQDGVDSNCDGKDGCLRDADGDGFGGTETLDNGDADCKDAGETPVGGDCDDANDAIHPLATDLPSDGLDTNCDGLEVCYVDGDKDGAGGTATLPGPFGCATSGVAPRPDDCDDATAKVRPGADDVPGDTIDQDCDGKLSCFVDADGDGVGGLSIGEGVRCDDAGLSSTANDCDDADDSVYPGADEIGGDGLDQDCSGFDGCFVDQDDDGYGAAEVPANGKACVGALSSVPGDCDDGNDAIHPAATEVVADSYDNDCDGFATCYEDSDHDGWGGDLLEVAPDKGSAQVSCTKVGRSDIGEDCDDSSPATHPEATDRLGVDSDCNGLAPCFQDLDGDDFGGDPLAVEVAAGDSADCEADGRAPNGEDCDDRDATSHPAGTELPGDAIDQDCDGTRDCYVDSDQDGVGSSVRWASGAADCVSGGLAAVSGDCDDEDDRVSPDAVETCDGVDNDCDAQVDEGYPWADPADPEATCDDDHVAFCGCASGGSSAIGWLGALGTFAARRRRTDQGRNVTPDQIV